MNSSLSSLQIAVLAAYAVGMAGGQLLFKAAALRLPAQGGLAERLFSLAHNGYFLAALAAYIGLTLVWVWVLSFTRFRARICSWRCRSRWCRSRRRWRSASRSPAVSCSAPGSRCAG